MKNLTLIEWDASLEALQKRILLQWPWVQTSIDSHVLRINTGAAAGRIRLDAESACVALAPDVKVTTGTSISGELHVVAHMVREYQTLVEVLELCAASMDSRLVWLEGKCPCDFCGGRGMEGIGRSCEYCNGKGVR
jgi:hypothetical protein